MPIRLAALMSDIIKELANLLASKHIQMRYQTYMTALLEFVEDFEKFRARVVELYEEWALTNIINKDMVNSDIFTKTTFIVKYLGCTRSREVGSTTEAVKTILRNAKGAKRVLQSVAVSVTLRGITVNDALTGEEIMDISVYSISHCSADSTHDRVFAFIAATPSPPTSSSSARTDDYIDNMTRMSDEFDERLRINDNISTDITYSDLDDIAFRGTGTSRQDDHKVDTTSDRSTHSTDTDDVILECHAFLCSKRRVTHALTLTLAQAFNAAYEAWRKHEQQKRNNAGSTSSCYGSRSSSSPPKRERKPPAHEKTSLIDYDVKNDKKNHNWVNFDDSADDCTTTYGSRQNQPQQQQILPRSALAVTGGSSASSQHSFDTSAVAGSLYSGDAQQLCFD